MPVEASGDVGQLASVLEAIALKDPETLDCHVTSRGGRLVVYVASTASLGDVRARLDGALRGVMPDCLLAVVARIPRLPDGAADEAKLESVKVFDTAAFEAIEGQIAAAGGIQPTAVSRELPPAPPRLLVGVLPDEPPPRLAEAPEVRGDVVVASNPPSLSEGGPLPGGSNEPATLCDVLERAAATFGGRGIMHVGPDRVEVLEPYARVLERARRVKGGLRAAGVLAGQPVIVALERSVDFAAGFWGAIVSKNPAACVAVPPVFRRDHPAVDRMLHAWQRLSGPPIIAQGSAVAGLRALSEELALGMKVLDIEQLVSAAPVNEHHGVTGDDVALFFMTSGSTGKPKLVPQRHSNLVAHARGSSSARAMQPHEVSLNWMPLDHVGGCVMHGITDTYVSNTQINVLTSVILADPLYWIDLINKHRVALTWAPNFAYALVVERLADVAKGRWDLSCARFFLNGGEAVVPRTAKRFVELLVPFGLPSTAMRPAYGMSELCSAISYSDTFRPETIPDDAQVADVGPPNPGVRIRIVDAHDEIVPEGVPGALQVKGPVVTTGYYNQPEANAEAFTADGWFKTGDVAIIRDGRLTITGREKEVVVVNGVKYACRDIEIVVEEVEGVEPSHGAATPARTVDAETEQLIIFISSPLEGAALAEVIRRIQGEVARRIGIAPRWVLPIPREEVPRTGIGKIERPKLRKRFEQGEFAAVCKQVEKLLGEGRALPDWFFSRGWVERAASPPSPKRGRTLVFTDRGGLGVTVVAGLDVEALAGLAGDEGAHTIVVEAAAAFSSHDAAHFRAKVDDVDQLERVLREVLAKGGLPTQIVHLLTCDEGAASPPACDCLGISSLVALVQAYERVRIDDAAVRLLVVSRRAADAGGATSVPALAGLAGMVRTLTSEHAWLDARHLDLAPKPSDGDAANVLVELEASRREREVAVRGDKRFVRVLRHWAPSEAHVPPSPIKRGGLYVVIGGLGGVGSVVTSALLRANDANVLVVGRTRLDEADAGPQTLIRLTPWKKLQAQSRPSQLRYAAVDVREPAALAAAVAEAEAAFGCHLDGVFFVAGSREEWLLAAQPAAYLPEAAAVWREGARSVLSMLEGRPDVAFLAVVPASGFLGGAGAGPYAVAAAALEALVARRAREVRAPARLVAFSPWESVGTSRDNPTLVAARSRGYLPVAPGTGYDSMLVALSHQEPTLLVGLDAGARHVRGVLDEAPLEAEELAAFCEGQGPARVAAKDALGREVEITVTVVPELPRDARGKVDRARLALVGAGVGTEGRFEPRSEHERALLEAWKDVLGSAPAKAAESFFAVGGDSIKAVQLVSRLRDALGVELPLHQLFETPGFEALAASVAQLGGRVARPLKRQSRDKFKARIGSQGRIEMTDSLRDVLRGQPAKPPLSR